MPFNIDEFRSHISNNNEFALSDKFEVIFAPPSKLAGRDMKPLTFQCEIAELPGKNINMIEYRHYGFIKRIPHHITYPEINITFLCNGIMTEKQLFDDWQNLMVPSDSGLVNYFNNNDYCSDIKIIQYSHIGNPGTSINVNGYQPDSERRKIFNNSEDIIAGENSSGRMVSDRPTNAELPLYNPSKIYECTLIEAMPVSVSSMPLNWADNSIHKLSVSFAYKKWILPGQNANPVANTPSTNYYDPSMYFDPSKII